MTRDEIKTLGIGSKLQLANGEIAAVQGLDQGNETITFQYEVTATATATDHVIAQGGWMMPKVISADGAIDPNPPPVSPPLVHAQQSTTVICKWVELANATKPEPL